MLFNSFIFIFGFLPLALVLTYVARPYSTPAKAILTILSLGLLCLVVSSSPGSAAGFDLLQLPCWRPDPDSLRG